jgi:hypothetical protein
MDELGCRSISSKEAALRLARQCAQRILQSGEDSLLSLPYFRQLMEEAGYIGHVRVQPTTTGRFLVPCSLRFRSGFVEGGVAALRSRAIKLVSRIGRVSPFGLLGG